MRDLTLDERLRFQAALGYVAHYGGALARDLGRVVDYEIHFAERVFAGTVLPTGQLTYPEDP